MPPGVPVVRHRSSSTTPMDPGTAIDRFPAGGFVRLRAPDRDMYAHADEDAIGVSMRSLGAVPSINGVWMVEHCYVDGDDSPFVLLQGAAYGRYLAVTNQRVPTQPGFRVIQRDYNSANLDPPFAWRPSRVDGGYVVLINWEYYLRGNIYGYRVDLCTVTADRELGWRTQWQVTDIPPSLEPLPLPPPPPPAQDVIGGLPDDELESPPLGRRIRYARANDEGDVDKQLADWPDFFFEGRSVFDLMTRVRLLLGDCGIAGITLCVVAGLNARPIPLLTGLPLNGDPMDLVVYTNGSPAASELKFPQFDQPELRAEVLAASRFKSADEESTVCL